MPAFILWANPSQVLPEGSVKGLYGVIKTEPSHEDIFEVLPDVDKLPGVFVF